MTGSARSPNSTSGALCGVQQAIRNGALCAPCLRLLPLTGAAVSMFLTPMHSRTFDATDEVAARIDELQFDLGEGPGWDAVTSAAPVLITDLRKRGETLFKTMTCVSDTGHRLAAANVSCLQFSILKQRCSLQAIDRFNGHP